MPFVTPHISGPQGVIVKLNLPPKWRLGAYIVTALGTPVIAYLKVKGYIGDAETALWGAEVTVVTALAAFNTDTSASAPEPDEEV